MGALVWRRADASGAASAVAPSDNPVTDPGEEVGTHLQSSVPQPRRLPYPGSGPGQSSHCPPPKRPVPLQPPHARPQRPHLALQQQQQQQQWPHPPHTQCSPQPLPRQPRAAQPPHAWGSSAAPGTQAPGPQAEATAHNAGRGPDLNANGRTSWSGGAVGPAPNRSAAQHTLGGDVDPGQANDQGQADDPGQRSHKRQRCTDRHPSSITGDAGRVRAAPVRGAAALWQGPCAGPHSAVVNPGSRTESVTRTLAPALAAAGEQAVTSAAAAKAGGNGGSGPVRGSVGSFAVRSAAGAGATAGAAAAAAAPQQRVEDPEAALAELRRQLAAKEAALRAKQADKVAKLAAQHTKKAALRAEAEQRRAQLSRGLSALAEAVAPEAGQGGAERAGAPAAGRPPPVRLAGPEDVQRVMRAASDYELLQLPIGCTAVEVRRAYRRLAASLHPDKCLAAGAQEAFIRATAAYNSLLRQHGG